MSQAQKIVSFLSLVAYIFIAYFTIRSNVFQLWGIFTLLFSCYIYFLYTTKKAIDTTIYYFISVGLVVRISLLFALPNFSDDFYRFYWDGLLWSNNINPFQYLPSEIMQQNNGIDGINIELFSKLNSPEYYTIYPPICQLFSYFSASIFPNNIYGAVVVLKSGMLAFEIGTLYFLWQLVKKWSLPLSTILIYWLNPLVIIELVGNIHFEAGMICFSLGTLYFLTQSKVKIQNKIFTPYFFFDKYLLLSTLCLSLAISAKLIPLIFLPFIFKRIGIVNATIYTLLTFAFIGVFFSAIINWEQLQNMFESVNLYFAKFEFNASLYYLARELGYYIKGWNMIATIGSYFSKIVFVIICSKALMENNASLKNLPNQWIFALWIYLLFATIVHPWYITPLIALSVFSSYQIIPLVWSYCIILSYHTYISSSYTENLYIVALEYILLFVSVIFTVKYRQKQPI